MDIIRNGLGGFGVTPPPYGNETGKWLEKCARYENAIALTFARTETKMFFNAVWGRATAIFFIKGRLTFYHVTGQKAKGAAGAPSVLIAYNEENANRLRDCNLNGKYIHLAPKLYFF